MRSWRLGMLRTISRCSASWAVPSPLAGHSRRWSSVDLASPHPHSKAVIVAVEDILDSN